MQIKGIGSGFIDQEVHTNPSSTQRNTDLNLLDKSRGTCTIVYSHHVRSSQSSSVYLPQSNTSLKVDQKRARLLEQKC